MLISSSHTSFSLTSFRGPPIAGINSRAPVGSSSNSTAASPEASAESRQRSASPFSSPTDPTRVDEATASEKSRVQAEQQQMRREIAALSARDREVRAHEQAHAAVGGQFAGAPRYEFQRGPDGVNYAVGGEVSIDVGREATPEATIRKAQIVRRAALAPAEPSPQDYRVAAQAARMELEARAALRIESGDESPVRRAENTETQSEQDPDSKPREMTEQGVQLYQLNDDRQLQAKDGGLSARA